MPVVAPSMPDRPALPKAHVRIVSVYYAGIEMLAIAAIVVMTGVAGLQVFYRYVLSDSLFWSEELMRYLMVWTAYLCAGMAYSRGEMLGMRFLVDACPPRVRAVVDGISRLIVVALLCSVAWYGLQFTLRTRAEEAVALEISLLWIHASVPIGAALLAVHVLFTGHFREAIALRNTYARDGEETLP